MSTRSIRRICALNNEKSPDILTAIVRVDDIFQAAEIVSFWETSTGEELPYNRDRWARTVVLPVELYFLFKRRRDLNRFVKMVSKEFPKVKIIV